MQKVMEQNSEHHDITKVLLIIPAYNEEKSILSTVNRVKDKFDYLVINDCSTDNTKEVCISNDLNYIDLPINLGIGGGIQTGYRYAEENGYQYVVQFDGDGQHNEDYIESIIKPLRTGEADMVIGSRYIKKEGFQSSFMRRLGINFFQSLIYLLSHQKITDATSGFRACNQKVISFFSKEYPQDYPEPQTNIALILKNYKVMEVPVIMNERLEGVSSITPLKSIYYMIKVTLAILLEYFRYR